MRSYLIPLLALLLINCGKEEEETYPVEILNPVEVSKSNNMPVYMHYMPWFVAKDGINNQWGIHWTMNGAYPDVFGTDGLRNIASHYYPLIGPYSTNDPLVIDYHLLLMKYAGIDGILINWYGQVGSNGDINQLLNHSNTIIDRTGESGLKFSVVMEDRFSRDLVDVTTNLKYLNDNYYTHDQYIKIAGDPLLLIFGPITVLNGSDWTTLLNSTSANERFLPLWYHTNKTGVNNASGEYAWVYETSTTGLAEFYDNVATDKIIGGAAYPGFNDYYTEGRWNTAALDWTIEVGTATLKGTLDLASENADKLDFVQLITWNDYGEGTMIEPTVEFGFTFLEEIQKFTGVGYGLSELELIHELFTKQKKYTEQDDKETLASLKQAYYYLVSLRVDEARAVIASIE